MQKADINQTLTNRINTLKVQLLSIENLARTAKETNKVHKVTNKVSSVLKTLSQHPIQTEQSETSGLEYALRLSILKVIETNLPNALEQPERVSNIFTNYMIVTRTETITNLGEIK